jgi:uncharacterized protein (DUF927 family)
METEITDDQPENVKREERQTGQIVQRPEYPLIVYSPSVPFETNRQEFTPKKKEEKLDSKLDFEEQQVVNEEEVGKIIPPISPTLNIRQEIADVVELDLENPLREDPNISADPAGNQMYFGCCVPLGYVISQAGVWRIKKSKDPITRELEDDVELVCRTRLMLTGKFVDINTGADVAEISFFGDRKVETLRIPMVATLGLKEWREHVRKNNYARLDVLDNELKATLVYIKETSIYNMQRINPADPKNSITAFKSGEASDRTGWGGNDFDKFIIGTVKYYNDSGKLKSNPHVFLDSKDAKADKRLQPKGTLYGWFNAIIPLLKHRKLKFAMYYALGSLFLAPLRGSNSAFGIIGDTSTGKTFTLMVIASMFGNPSEKGDGLILNGDISITALNAILTTLTDIPVFIDEITMMDDDTKKSLTYAIGNGQEALRGKQDGNLRSSRMIRSNAIISGEVDIVSEFAHTGAQVRFFSCRDRPLPEIEQATIRNAKNGILDNYGHLLPAILNKYFTEPKKIKGWYEISVCRLENTTSDILAKRKADYFAVAEVGGHLLEDLLKDNGLPFDNPGEIVNEAWDEYVLGDPDTPLEIKALEKAYNWAMSHPRNFLVNDEHPLEDHADDIYGWWVTERMGGPYVYLDFNKQELEKFLKNTGYDKPLGILQYWRNHDITICNTSVKTGKKLQDGSKKLLTFAVPHYYKYNQPAQTKGIIRVKMDKIRELVEIVDTKPQVIVGLSQFCAKKEESIEQSAVESQDWDW